MPQSTPSQIPPKPVLLFATHALVLALLIGFWPSARAVYPEIFRAQARAVFGAGEPPALTLRKATGPALGEKDTFVEAFDVETEEPAWRLSISAVRLEYWPSAVLVAMLLATPMGARRRLLAVGLGVAWLHVFALGRLGLEILRAFAELQQGSAAEASGPLLAYRTVSVVLNSNIVVIAAVFLGWVAVASPRRRLDTRALTRLLGTPGARRRVP